MVNKSLENPGVTCQTLALERPGSDYIGDVDHAISGKPCVQWNLVPFESYPNRYRLRSHNKCRNTDYKLQYGAFCYTADVDSSGKQTFEKERCIIPGILLAPTLKIKLD